MSDRCSTLFVFEGVTEDSIVSSLERHFMGGAVAIKCAFCGDIYQFYRKLKEDDFSVDVLTLLKHRNKKNRSNLEGYSPDSFAYIYFFFDYDGHATKADDGKVAEMLEFFNNETENGKLFISYPMVESVRHYKDRKSFKDLVVKCKGQNCPNTLDCERSEECMSAPRYKTFVPTDSDLNAVKLNSPERWKELIDAHLCKGHFVVDGGYSRPTELLVQSEVFRCQLEKYISQPCPVVAVLSAFPLFVQDYYGVSKLNEKLESES